MDSEEVGMDRVTAIVVKLSNGKYRRLNLGKIKSIYTDAAYICNGEKLPGEDDVAGPETDKPDFSDSADKAALTAADNGDDGNGGPPECYLINGYWVCT
jgi:hypothetical protein